LLKERFNPFFDDFKSFKKLKRKTKAITIITGLIARPCLPQSFIEHQNRLEHRILTRYFKHCEALLKTFIPDTPMMALSSLPEKRGALTAINVRLTDIEREARALLEKNNLYESLVIERDSARILARKLGNMIHVINYATGENYEIHAKVWTGPQLINYE